MKPLALILAMIAGPALSQGCAPRQVVLDKLAETFGETRRGIGLAANRAVVEVFASQKTGTWTVTVTDTNGVTCVIASGTDFETETTPLGDKI